MVELGKIASLCLAAVMFIAVVREQRPEIARQLSIAAGLIVFALVLWRFAFVLDALSDLAGRVGFAPGQMAVVVRAVGIAYIAEFASAVCRDAGETALAAKLELAGKIAILVIALPIILAVFDMVFRLLA